MPYPQMMTKQLATAFCRIAFSERCRSRFAGDDSVGSTKNDTMDLQASASRFAFNAAGCGLREDASRRGSREENTLRRGDRHGAGAAELKARLPTARRMFWPRACCCRRCPRGWGMGR